MRKHLITALMLGGLTMLIAGCTTYYQVNDPASGKAYYTTKVSDAGRGGAVKIKDEKTGSMVTLQSSEIKEISEEQYKAGLVAKAPAKPAPIQPAAAQPAAAQPAPAQPASTEPAAAPSVVPAQK